MNTKLVHKIPNFTAYIATLYFLEIIRLMFSVGLAFDKLITGFLALVTAILLVLHIIRLYARKETNRMIQLFLIDIHLALTAVFIYNNIIQPDDINIIHFIFLINNLVLIVCEIPLLFLLTKKEVVTLYKQ